MTNGLISILLSTYNSEKYLCGQIESILNQSHKRWTLYIRDDGSTDATLYIIKKYCSQHPNIILLESEHKNIGAKNSFFWLFNQVDASYYMFCDHDDVWLPFKIERTYEKMLDVEQQHPDKAILIHTDAIVVDSNLNSISASLWKYSRANPKLLKRCEYLCVSNCATGCTIMINHKAKEVSLPIPAQAIMHDWWIALCVSKNGLIDYIEAPTILYRQHDKNTIGAPIYAQNYLLSKLMTISLVLKRNIKNYEMVVLVNKMSIFRYICRKLAYHFMRQQYKYKTYK
jgi:glycosyltransferase involved in cell wall biosynthesis